MSLLGFWRSELLQGTILSLDRRLSTACRSLAVVAALALTHLEPHVASSRTVHTASQMFCSIHLFMLYFQPTRYLRLRTPLLLLLRFWNLIALATLYSAAGYESHVRSLCGDPSFGVYAYLATMLPLASITQALTSPLPFLWQLPLVLLKTSLDVALAVPKLDCAIHGPGSHFAQHAERVCSWTLGGAHRAGQLLFQLPEVPLCAGDGAPLRTLVFGCLYLGGVLPLCAALWLQQSLLARYQQQQQEEEQLAAELEQLERLERRQEGGGEQAEASRNGGGAGRQSPERARLLALQQQSLPLQQQLEQQEVIRQLDNVWPYRLFWLAAWAIPCVATTHAIVERGGGWLAGGQCGGGA